MVLRAHRSHNLKRHLDRSAVFVWVHVRDFDVGLYVNRRHKHFSEIGFKS